jgi:hypothetical protein
MNFSISVKPSDGHQSDGHQSDGHQSDDIIEKNSIDSDVVISNIAQLDMSKSDIESLLENALKKFRSANDSFQKIINEIFLIKDIKKRNKIVNSQINNSTDTIDILYSDITRLLKDPNVIRVMTNIINIYNIWQKKFMVERVQQNITSKKILSMYMTMSFPENILGDIDSTTKKMVHDTTKELYEFLNKTLIGNISFSIDKFKEVIDKYSVRFDDFITQDKKIKVMELINKWYDDEITKGEVIQSPKYSSEQKNAVVKHLNRSQDTTINFIKRFDCKFNILYLNEYKKVLDKAHNMANSIFWNLLTAELIDSKYDMYFTLLEEIKNDLLILTPASRVEFNEFIDIEFIKQKVQHHVMNNGDFIALYTYIVDKIIELQSPIKNDYTKSCWEIIMAKIQDNSQEHLFEIAMANSVKFILDILKDTKDDCYEFYMNRDFI